MLAIMLQFIAGGETYRLGQRGDALIKYSLLSYTAESAEVLIHFDTASVLSRKLFADLNCGLYYQSSPRSTTST